jgi:hypothetical protein
VKALENKIDLNSAELREHNEHTGIMNIQLKYMCEALIHDKSKLEKIKNDILKH